MLIPAVKRLKPDVFLDFDGVIDLLLALLGCCCFLVDFFFYCRPFLLLAVVSSLVSSSGRSSSDCSLFISSASLILWRKLSKLSDGASACGFVGDTTLNMLEAAVAFSLTVRIILVLSV